MSSERKPMRPRLGHFEGDDRAAGVARTQVGDAALARCELLGDGADVLVGHVAHAALERLVLLAVDFLGDDLGRLTWSS
jgi:hypothetical protein